MYACSTVNLGVFYTYVYKYVIVLKNAFIYLPQQHLDIRMDEWIKSARCMHNVYTVKFT